MSCLQFGLVTRIVVIITNNKKYQRNGPQRVNTNGGTQKISKIVKQVLQSTEEKKFFLSNFSSTVDSTMQNVDLSGIPQGTTASSRVGATIKVHKLNLRWSSYLGDTTNMIRVVIFHWKPNDAVDVPQSSELFQTTSTLAPLLKITPNRYTILHDMLISMDTYHPMKVGVLQLKLAQLVSFVPGLDTGMNHVYLSVFSDSGGVPNPTFEFVASLTYTDV